MTGRRTESFNVPGAYRAKEQQPHEFRHAKQRTKRSKSPLWARLCVVFGVILVLLPAMAYGGLLFVDKRYDNNITRADLLGRSRSDGKKAKFPLNFLIIGTDKRVPEDFDPHDPSSRVDSVEGERADTIIFVHIPEGKQKAYVVSIPRDSLVRIPPLGKYKGGKDKINASYVFGEASGVPHGGAQLLVATVNKMLGVTIDYPLIVHFKAIRELTDAVGGVDVVVDKQVQDPRSGIVFPAGSQHLNGKTAEVYVRQRYGLLRGDYDRQQRQRQFLLALINRITQTGIVTNPKKLDHLLITATNNVTIDQSMPVSDLVLSLKSIRPNDAVFMGLKMLPSAMIDGVSYEIVDELVAQELGQAMNTNTLPEYLAKYPPEDASRGR